MARRDRIYYLDKFYFGSLVEYEILESEAKDLVDWIPLRGIGKVRGWSEENSYNPPMAEVEPIVDGCESGHTINVHPRRVKKVPWLKRMKMHFDS